MMQRSSSCCWRPLALALAAALLLCGPPGVVRVAHAAGYWRANSGCTASCGSDGWCLADVEEVEGSSCPSGYSTVGSRYEKYYENACYYTYDCEFFCDNSDCRSDEIWTGDTSSSACWVPGKSQCRCCDFAGYHIKCREWLKCSWVETYTPTPAPTRAPTSAPWWTSAPAPAPTSAPTRAPTLAPARNAAPVINAAAGCFSDLASQFSQLGRDLFSNCASFTGSAYCTSSCLKTLVRVTSIDLAACGVDDSAISLGSWGAKTALDALMYKVQQACNIVGDCLSDATAYAKKGAVMAAACGTTSNQCSGSCSTAYNSWARTSTASCTNSAVSSALTTTWQGLGNTMQEVCSRASLNSAQRSGSGSGGGGNNNAAVIGGIVGGVGGAVVIAVIVAVVVKKRRAAAQQQRYAAPAGAGPAAIGAGGGGGAGGSAAAGKQMQFAAAGQMAPPAAAHPGGPVAAQDVAIGIPSGFPPLK